MTRKISLGDIATIYSGGTPSRIKPEYWNGNIPWVKTTLIQNCVIKADDVDEWITEKGLKKSSAKMVPKGSILMAMIGQGKTRGQVAILDFEATTNQNAAAIVLNKNNHSRFVYQQLLFRYKTIRNISNSSGQQNLNLALIRTLKFPQIEFSEQKAIAEVLSTWDRAIEKTECLIQAKEKRFAGLVGKLLCNPAFKRGHVREFTTEVSVRNKGQKISRVLSVTNHSGFVLPEDQFQHSVASSNLSNYKVVSRGEYAYNPSRINVGSIARLNDWDEGVLSPMYVVFSIGSTKVDSDFFLHWLSSHEAKQRIKKSAQGSVRETVSFPALGSIPFPMPGITEQKRIAKTLNTAQREIDLLKKLADKYKAQKRGLMQKLLTGSWRVKGGLMGEVNEKTETVNG